MTWNQKEEHILSKYAPLLANYAKTIKPKPRL